MKAMVIYNSQTGFTKRYAQWIAEELSCDCVSFQEKDTVDVNAYDTVVFGSWCHAGNILKKEWILQVAKEHPGKRCFAFAVGASPKASPDIPVALEKNFPADSAVKGFYMQGGLAYDKMKWSSRLMMQMLCTAMKVKKNCTPAEDKMLEMISHSYDISDKKYIGELVEAVRG